MDKDRELELKVEMFCATIRSDRQLCDESRYKPITTIAADINNAFNILNKG